MTERVMGLKVSVFTLDSIKSAIVNYIKEKKQKVFFGYSLVLLPRFRTCPDIFRYSDTFDVFLADGKGMFWLFRLAGVPLKSDISLPDLANIVLRLADENGFKVLLLGADDETNSTATSNIRKDYPGAFIVDGINGYFKKEEEDSIVERINKSAPDIILIGISSPKKEEFVHDHRDRINSSILIPCGGVIDVLAGKTKREPVIIKKTGMTWLYRFMQEPGRLFRPVLLNGLSVFFSLLPVVLFNLFIKRNKKFSIPAFYGIKQN